jgi:fluoride ion exporter CrcB/FEX
MIGVVALHCPRIPRGNIRSNVLVSPFFGLMIGRARERVMPSLFRFLTLIGVLGGLTYGAMFMLASWVDPKPREITVSIPPDRFAKQP